MTPEVRAESIKAAEGPRILALVREAVALVRNRRLSATDKADRIIDITDALSRTIVPHTPCAGGTCSHCCYMATAISGYEARMIGRYVGREPQRLGREGVASVRLEHDLRDKFTGARCTFLDANGRCGIYPVRPAACRLHHSLNDDESNCYIHPSNMDISVPHMNLTLVTAAVAVIFVAEDFGDIREFFPPESAP